MRGSSIFILCFLLVSIPHGQIVDGPRSAIIHRQFNSLLKEGSSLQLDVALAHFRAVMKSVHEPLFCNLLIKEAMSTISDKISIDISEHSLRAGNYLSIFPISKYTLSIIYLIYLFIGLSVYLSGGSGYCPWFIWAIVGIRTVQTTLISSYPQHSFSYPRLHSILYHSDCYYQNGGSSTAFSG